MSSNAKNDSLIFEIKSQNSDLISTITVTAGFEIIVKVSDRVIIGEIILKKINKKSVVDWKNTLGKLMNDLKESKIDQTLLTVIHLKLAQNIEECNKFITSIYETEKSNEKSKNDIKFEIKTFKYYSEQEQRLYESVIISGMPFFVSYLNDVTILVERIEENTRILTPFDKNDSAVKSFEFKDKDHLESIIKQCKVMTISGLYQRIKQIVSKYIDQEQFIINFITADIIFSYFLDRFPTTHYLFFVGTNDVGKSTIGDVLEHLCYRGVKMTSPSVANIYRLLGKVESAQCTIIMDEADQIDDNNDLMNILKTGYELGGKVPKINPTTYQQEFFNSYSFKAFLAERLPSQYKARGLMDRTFPISCLSGNPQLSFKEILVNQGLSGNKRIKELWNEINDTRKILFGYRLLHAFDNRPEICTGLRNRDKELCECIKLFFDSPVQEEVEFSFQKLLDIRYEQKVNSFEAKLLHLIVELLKTSNHSNEIFLADLWNSIKNTMICQEINDNELYFTEDNFTLYRNQLSRRCQIFGGKPKHTNKGNMIVFRDISKLEQILSKYTASKPVIHCTIQETEEYVSEGSESGESKNDQYI
ncbi:MAG TPA: hypothetical protein VFG45_11175 [Candidatus Nitrosocosmicus sp.]|nr:hypothetical protein [Candidatus Nitrosocosmicus sp.]